MNTGVAPAGANEGRMEVKEASASYVVEAGSRASKGYKQTEVGVIPEDWEVTYLYSLAKVPMQNGLFFKPSLKGSGVKLINVGDLYGRIPIASDALELFDATDKERERFKVRDGDLFFTRSSVVPSGIAQCNYYCSPKPESVVFDSHVIRLRADTSKVVPSFLFRFCVASIARQYLVSHAKTGTMTTIDQGVLGKCPVVLPPHFEQEAIAEALSDADALIESLEQLLAKKRQIKQGAMQELLTGKKRLPGFSGEWETERISNFSAFVTKGSTPTTYGFNWEDDGVLFLRSECVSADGLDLTQSMFISEAAHAVLQRGEVRAGDILMTITGNVGRVVRLAADFGIANINQHIARIRINHRNVSADFVFHWLSQANVRANYTLITTGQAYPQISLKQVRETRVPLPSLPEQTAIANHLSDMDTELAALESKLAKARQIKQGMMQELLTGRIRLI